MRHATFKGISLGFVKQICLCMLSPTDDTLLLQLLFSLHLKHADILIMNNVYLINKSHVTSVHPILTRVREVFHNSISLCWILSLRLRDFSYAVRPMPSNSAFTITLLILVQEKQIYFGLYMSCMFIHVKC